jgi:hypothetical protein
MRTTKAMRKIVRKLNRVVDLHLMACGHDAEVQKAVVEQIELENTIRDSLEASYVQGQIDGARSGPL